MLVHLVRCNSYQRLGGDPATGGAGSKITRTTTLEYQDFSIVFEELCLFQDFPRSVQTLYISIACIASFSCQNALMLSKDNRFEMFQNYGSLTGLDFQQVCNVYDLRSPVLQLYLIFCLSFTTFTTALLASNWRDQL